jgi:hypothetical protein
LFSRRLDILISNVLGGTVKASQHKIKFNQVLVNGHNPRDLNIKLGSVIQIIETNNQPLKKMQQFCRS